MVVESEVASEMVVFNQQGVIDEFEAKTKDAGRVQKETLRRILEENGDCEYLQKFGLRGRTDAESFKSHVPLCTHSDLEHYIQRISDGEESPILTGKCITSISLTYLIHEHSSPSQFLFINVIIELITVFSTCHIKLASSGTTQGRPKFVPFNDELVKSSMQIFQTSFAFRNREYPIGNGRALKFIYSSKEFKTKGGLPASTATTNVYRSNQFEKTTRAIQFQGCSPDEVISGPDFHQSLYCHLLCGLIFSDEVQLIFSTFAHSIVHAFRTLEHIWQDLCKDIRVGAVSDRITVPSIRAAVSKLLRPNPELADAIFDKCSRLSNWYGVIPQLWPNAKYVYGIMTGSMIPYMKKLRHYAGNLPLVSADYGSSEGWIGANVSPWLPPESAIFAVLPDIGYFEFIPLSGKPEICDDDTTIEYKEAEPLSLTQVTVGEEYEVVVTSFAGLYRYRLGDVVKVMGFHNSTPELQFIRRRSLLLSINIDKITEKDLQLAVEEAGKRLAEEKLDICDFTSHSDSTTEPGHYVIFWELNGEATEEALNECCNCLDRSLVDAGYVGSRRVKAIGPLELRTVRGGTFNKILDHYLGLGAAVNQFKTPRCVGMANIAVLQILCDNVVKSCFSTYYD